MSDPSWTVPQWRQRFAGLHTQDIDLSLGRMRQVLARLNHPERRIGPHIHVSGTNGKGGVIAALTAGLHAGGLTTQAYTSPYLWQFEENICLNGTPIGSALCAQIFAQVWAARGDIPLTWFEVDTLVALLAFAENKADISLIECGMGGAHDATNVVGVPLAAILTNVGGDHSEFLGTDLQAVAVEKAGIAKGAPLYVPEDFPFNVGPVRTVTVSPAHPSLNLANGVLATHFPDLAPVTTPPPQTGRWQRVGNTIYDVGHNAHAATHLAAKLAQEPGPYCLRVGMLRRKDPEAFLAAFAPLKPWFQAVDLGDTGHSTARLVSIAASLGMPLHSGQTWSTQLITGSHQTVALTLARQHALDRD